MFGHLLYKRLATFSNNSSFISKEIFYIFVKKRTTYLMRLKRLRLYFNKKKSGHLKMMYENPSCNVVALLKFYMAFTET